MQRRRASLAYGNQQVSFTTILLIVGLLDEVYKYLLHADLKAMVYYGHNSNL